MPPGIHLLVLGGIPGTGVKSVGLKLRGALETHEIAVEAIDDDTFHVLGPTCEICNQVTDIVGHRASACLDNPTDLAVEALYPCIVRSANTLINSDVYKRNGGVGIIVIQGRHVMSDALLRETAGDLTFWLGQENDVCQVRNLRSRGLWKFNDDVSALTTDNRLAGFVTSNRDFTQNSDTTNTLPPSKRPTQST